MLVLLHTKKYRKAEYVQCRVCFVNVQSPLHENVVFSICARMDNAAYTMFIMWNSISDLDAWYHFQFKFEVVFIFEVIFIFEVVFIIEIIFTLRSFS